ncbi:MAG: NAD(P)-dependent glycerol-3-phosphate dehydrogenase, partial [Deltaproteobacteria bacterium]|nr:NAD(P)-dependent glycerol-3-phosphate dehydrogenase [Deltaproteobacteria bacterium]
MEGRMERIAVIGAGSWGTTLGNMLAEKGHEVDLWVREQEVYQQIKEERINHTFLPGMRLTARLNPVTSFDEALRDKEIVLLVVPSHVFRAILEGVRPHIKTDMSLVSATKGIENKSLETMSQVAEGVLSDQIGERFACLAGPSFAKEVFVKRPTAVTIASRDMGLAERLQRVFSTEHFRVYTSQDLIGVQLCGAIKNVIAIAAGASDGLNFGNNARAALITRGLAEITRLGVSMGANPMTFAGLAGMGDLVLTCTGDLSRNRTVGIKIGKGMGLGEITGAMTMVAEGIR